MANRPLSTGPSLKTLCKLAVIQYSLDQSCLPHDIRYCVLTCACSLGHSSPGCRIHASSNCALLLCYRWELSAMTTNSTISRPIVSSQG